MWRYLNKKGQELVSKYPLLSSVAITILRYTFISSSASAG
jgi:hypothetical protein